MSTSDWDQRKFDENFPISKSEEADLERRIDEAVKEEVARTGIDPGWVTRVIAPCTCEHADHFREDGKHDSVKHHYFKQFVTSALTDVKTDYSTFHVCPDCLNTCHLPEFRYVNVYRVDRYYGGPEEGGWYYDAGTIIATYPFKPAIEGAEDRARALAEETYPEHAEKPSRYSVIGTPDTIICVEDEPGADFPTERPHYE